MMLLDHSAVTQKETQLIRLYATREQDQSAWEAFFSDIELDDEGFPFNYMLSRLGARFGWHGVPKRLVPRLQGVRRVFQVKNVALMARALKLMGVIQDQGIPMLVMRGGALRMGLLPDVPQKMADIDIVVPPESFARCREALVDHGYDVTGFWSHSVDIDVAGEHCADLHWCMFKGNVHSGEPTSLIASRGTKVTKQGVTFAIPSAEDVFLNIVTNAAANFIMRQCGKGPISWMADCVDLAERHEVSFVTVVDHAREYGVLDHLGVGVALMRYFLPDAFPELYELVDSTIDLRSYRRMRACLRCLRVTDEEFMAYPAPLHLAHALRLIYHENACSYHLGDPTSEVVSSYVGLLRDRLENYDNINHVWELPGLVLRRARVWEERKRERGFDA